MKTKIYLDYMSTTPTLRSVNDAVARFQNDTLLMVTLAGMSLVDSSSRYRVSTSTSRSIDQRYPARDFMDIGRH